MTSHGQLATAACDRQQILRARALALAREVLGDPRPEDGRDVVAFVAAQERFAVEAACVREVCRLRDLTAVPCTPPHVCGIVNVRGQILTVLDLRRLLDLPERGLVDRQHVILVHGAGVESGLLADGTPTVQRIRAAEIRPVPITLAAARARYLTGITADGLALLDVPRLLGDANLVVNQEVAPAPTTSQPSGELTT
jgi:purine-binding chemotaxis protein CheW